MKRGTIYQQPGCTTWTIQYYRNGKRVRESVGSDDYRAAQVRLTKRLAQCDRGEQIADIGRKSATVTQLWEGLERHYRIQKRKSAECLRRRWKHLGAFFADMAACNVTYDRLEEYVDMRLSEKAENATINRELAALKTAFRLARKKQTMQVPDFPHLTENNVRTGFLEDREYMTLTANCSELWMRLFLEIAYSFAWRKSEILNLKVANISMSARTIRLNTGSTKNDEGREVAMTQRIAALAEQAIADKAKDDYLLTRDDGKRVKDFRKAWAKLIDAAGLEGLFLHDLRRSGARQLRRAGVPESVIQKIGGWKTAAMFKRYAIVSSADQKAAIEKLEQSRADSHDFSHDSRENAPSGVVLESGKVN
jgi:integrase